MKLSPNWGKWYPCTHLIPFNGTIEEEIKVLRHLLQNDSSNLFKELYILNYEFAPRLRLNEAENPTLLHYYTPTIWEILPHMLLLKTGSISQLVSSTLTPVYQFTERDNLKQSDSFSTPNN